LTDLERQLIATRTMYVFEDDMGIYYFSALGIVKEG
jgi:hypothetical protein